MNVPKKSAWGSRNVELVHTSGCYKSKPLYHCASLCLADNSSNVTSDWSVLNPNVLIACFNLHRENLLLQWTTCSWRSISSRSRSRTGESEDGHWRWLRFLKFRLLLFISPVPTLNDYFRVLFKASGRSEYSVSHRRKTSLMWSYQLCSVWEVEPIRRKYFKCQRLYII